MKRRDFFKVSALVAASAGVNNAAKAALPNSLLTEQDSPNENKLIASAPMLQNYAENSVGVAFAVNAMANGFVTYGLEPDLSDGITVKCGGYRVTDMNDSVMQVRLTNLKPATTYYYRIGADKIEYKNGYNMKVLDTEIDENIYHFITAGAEAKSHFCVINDTHVRWEPFSLVIEKTAALAPSCVIWNGDASNVEETIEAQIRIFLKPEIERTNYASQIPYLFCPGNHDMRGMANRYLERVWMYRQPEERLSKYWDLGRNFAIRMGDIAMIGLDTAEDKMDTNPILAGLFNSGAYREAQAIWLQDALQQPEIKSAPYLVAFCHIPLYDPDPHSNPGDIAPADKDPQYTTDYAAWQRTCAKLWSPLLQEEGCQAVITAHQHRYRFDAPTEDRTWAQIVGGGPDLGFTGSGEKRVERPELFPTVIEGKIADNKMQIIVHNLVTGKVQAIHEFDPRKL